MRLCIVISIDQTYGEHFIVQIHTRTCMDTHTLAYTHIYDQRTHRGGVAKPKSRGLIGRGGGSLLVRSRGLAHTHTCTYMYIYMYIYIFMYVHIYI